MPESFRDEHDSLGPVKVPRDALYGAQTQRALANFPISGRTAHRSLNQAYLRLKAAAARANQAAGVLSAEHSSLITRAVDEILAMPHSEWPRIFRVDAHHAGAGTSQNMNV